MKDEDYEELFDLYKTPTDTATVLRHKTNASELILRKRLKTSDPKLYKSALKEILQRKKLENTYISNILRANIDVKNNSVTGYYEHSKYPVSNITFNNLEAVVQLALNTLNGLVYLHQYKLAHGDIRPETIYYFDEEQRFKVIDRLTWKPAIDVQKEHIGEGKGCYTDPAFFNEVMSGVEGPIDTDLYKNDVFAIGIMLVQVMEPHILNLDKIYDTRSRTFSYDNFNAQLKSVLEAQKNGDFRRFLELIIDTLLEPDTDERLTAEKSLQAFETFAKTINLTEPKLTLRKSSVYSKSLKTVYLGATSDQFQEDEVHIGENPSRLSNYLKRSVFNSKPASTKNEPIDRIEADRDSKSVRSHVIGFVADVDEFSGESVDYQNEQFKTWGNNRGMTEYLDSRATQSANRFDKQIDTEKKQVAMTEPGEEAYIEIEIRSRVGTRAEELPQTVQLKVIQLDDINDLRIQYDSKTSSRIELGYSIGTRSCKKIIEMGSLADMPVQLRIKHSKTRSALQTPYEVSSPFRNKVQNSQTTLKSFNPQPIRQFNVNSDVANGNKVTDLYVHIPISYKEKLLSYRQSQRVKGVRSHQYRLNTIDCSSYGSSLVYKDSKFERVKSESDEYMVGVKGSTNKGWGYKNS